MRFPEAPLEARFLRRYKRFFADVELPDGSTLTAHCPNTGSLTGCLEEGARVWLRDSRNPERKLRYTWQAIELAGTWVNVDTMLPNRVVAEAVEAGRVPELAGATEIRREVAYGKGSRIDLLVTDRQGKPCYVEVKSTTLVDGSAALFPDAVTERGRKHLDELARLARKGVRAVQFFLINRADVFELRPADHIDREYGKALRRAARAGVEVLAYRSLVGPREMRLGEGLPVVIPPLPRLPRPARARGR